ncbi:HhoA/HhoB/HtrA family serine endopeptidase [Phormidium sp. CCY1219]|uniref:HhoA/HhoB/HtrA family serine endopeptidase n=1 Tax=Phormidium sp. CCY1219 TaxID=2886104 RepID=UPI002D1F4FEA|nr:HhoA/HhoB/HtrA family serine endopeptidase [Phormidium sp. CCY1219]MEB3829254.1 trypsin-like peptidase domain-containing protein [Phormidium sp. CCY1219]
MHGSNISRGLRQMNRAFVSLLLSLLLAFHPLSGLYAQATPTGGDDAMPTPTDTLALQPKQTLRRGGSFVTAAVETIGPAVVRLDTERTISRRADPFFQDPFLRDFFGPNAIPAPREELLRGQGSGFIIDSNGLILTNAHVVSRADKVTVTLKDGRTFEGEVRGTDEVTDLAVVKINDPGEQLPVAALGDSSQVRVGDWAIAVGNPLGLDNTVTLGIISTLERSSSQVGVPDKRLDFLQTDAAINPGNSGGPLLNENGEVIGINTAIRPDARGIGFAIPINKAKALTDVLARGEQVPHPYVGIQMITLTPELARQNNEDRNSTIVLPEVNGVLVMRVMSNTPAERAGIRRGDIILSVNGIPVTTADRLQDIVENSGVNQTLRVQVQRGSRNLELRVKTAQLENGLRR